MGPVRNWSGLEAPDHGSWLLDHAEGLGFNAILFSPFQITSNAQTFKHNAVQSGSLYAIRDHFALDPEFSAGSAELDRDHLRHFTDLAKQKNIRVFADLVFNHIALDHPLVQEENAAIRAIIDSSHKSGKPLKPILIPGENGEQKIIGVAYEDKGPRQLMFKFARTMDLQALTPLNFTGTTGHDTVQINYDSPEAYDFFIRGKDGKPGYWKQVIDYFIDAGFDAFRCDLAYRVPAGWWQELISYAHEKIPDTVFMAETLGGSAQQIEALGQARITQNGKDRPAFDLGMISNHWWDFISGWLWQEEKPRLARMAHFGGAAAPDNHDTQNTVAGFCAEKFSNAGKYPQLMDEQRKQNIISDICLRNYAVSVLIANSAIMQMGYEYCKEKQNEVFRGWSSPQDWKSLLSERGDEDHPLNISERIRRINALKEALNVENCRVVVKDCSLDGDPRLVKIQCSYIDVDTNEETASIVMLVNKKPQHGPIRVTEQQMEDTKNRCLDRLVLGEGDITDRTAIHEIMILHTPVKTKGPAPAVSRAPCPQPAL